MTRIHAIPGTVSKALRTLLFALLFSVVGTPTFAQSLLPPGTTTDIPVPLISNGTPPFGDTLLQEVQSAVFATDGANTISGKVTSAAIRNASGFLDFTYQLSFDANTNIFVDALSLASFKNGPGVAIGQTAEDPEPYRYWHWDRRPIPPYGSTQTHRREGVCTPVYSLQLLKDKVVTRQCRKP